MKRIYVAGPMRGKPLYNFPAFDKAANQLRSEGWFVVNPADLDRERGFKETDATPSWNFLRAAIMLDLGEISTCDAIAVLPGWEESEGATVEVALAKFLGLQVIVL